MFQKEAVRSTKEIKRGLLKKAFAEGRGREMILLILWRAAASKHYSLQGKDALAKFNQENFGQPRAVRMMNVISEREGEVVRFSDNSIVPTAPGSATLN